MDIESFLRESARDHNFGDPPSGLPGIAIEVAIRWARMSPCRKSRRGCAVFDPKSPGISGIVIGAGFNGQPPPWRCDGTCNADGRCARLCIHAENRAIDHALLQLAEKHHYETETRMAGLELVHVKVDESGQAVASGGPSCWQCSRLVVEQKLDAVWLFQHGTVTDASGIGRHTPASWVRWSAQDFHHETTRACGLVGPVSP